MKSHLLKVSCKTHRGITLIELMVVILVVGILTVVAVGSYSSYVLKTHRIAAQTTMLEVLSQQQNYFARNMIYVEDLSELGYTVTDGKLIAAEGRYAITADKCAAPLSTELTICIQLTATALGAQATDGNLGANSGGGKTPADKW